MKRSGNWILMFIRDLGYVGPIILSVAAHTLLEFQSLFGGSSDPLAERIFLLNFKEN